MTGLSQAKLTPWALFGYAQINCYGREKAQVSVTIWYIAREDEMNHQIDDSNDESIDLSFKRRFAARASLRVTIASFMPPLSNGIRTHVSWYGVCILCII